MDSNNQFERDLVVARSVRIGTCRLDRTLNEVHDGTRCSRLMPKAAAVLEVLVHFAGQSVSKERLLLEVWRGEFPTEDVITNAISQLRKAFGDDARDARYIRTVPRVGYVLLADLAAEIDAVPADGPAPAVRGATGDVQERAIVAIETDDRAILARDGGERAIAASDDGIALDVLRSDRTLHAWMTLFLVLLAFALGLLIGGTHWRAAQAPQHLVPLGGPSASRHVTYRHVAHIPSAVVSISSGFCRDGGQCAARWSAHRQRMKDPTWT